MADFHVKLDKEGNIVAGTITKNGVMNNKSIVTGEAFEAVRDHLLFESQKQQQDIAYAWTYKDGKTLILKLEQKDAGEIKEGE